MVCTVNNRNTRYSRKTLLVHKSQCRLPKIVQSLSSRTVYFYSLLKSFVNFYITDAKVEIKLLLDKLQK